MPFTRGTFFGASIRGFRSSLGLNGSVGQLDVQVVEDPVNLDSFSATSLDINKPAYFQFYSFQFNGILQKFQKVNSTTGLPTYDLTLVDPKEILDCVQIIIGGYNGPVSVKNLFNAYGYWENQGFGLSYLNDGGMPWFRIKDALVNMADTPVYGNYGGPINFAGQTYSLDLSELPVPPNYYRIGGNSVSLLEAISQICEDGACDYWVTLDGLKITLKTISRLNQPPLGTITSITESNTGNIVSSSSGLEGRNETTSAFLVGGDINTLHIVENDDETLTQFWGYDVDGNVIEQEEAYLWIPYWDPTAGYGITADTPQPRAYVQLNQPDSVTGWVYDEFTDSDLNPIIYSQMRLNASPIADIIGNTFYNSNVLEMLAAKGNQQSWLGYMASVKPAMAAIIGIVSPIKTFGVFPSFISGKPDVIADGRDDALALSAITTDRNAKIQRVYEYIKGIADEFLGKKYLVSLPFILNRTDPETLKIFSSYEISDAGYLNEDAEPLALSSANQDLLKTQDGRFKAFVRYDNITELSADLSRVSHEGSVIQDELLFIECGVDQKLVYVSSSPYALIHINAPVSEQAVDTVGNSNILAALLQMQPYEATKVLSNPQFGNIGIRIAPSIIDPNSAAIPLKSNISTYGPWFASGANGKVKFEHDSSLVPWNYGGYDVMNLAGYAKVNNAVTNMQISEAGSIEFGGAPTVSLGDVLHMNGPNVTNIEVSFGTNGVTTNYRFQTYTQRFGTVPRFVMEKIRKNALTNQDFKKNIRLLNNQKEITTFVKKQADNTEKVFMGLAPPYVKKESPHEIFIGKCEYDIGYGHVRVGVSTATTEEALVSSNANDDSEFIKTSAMNLNGLLRPFCTAYSSGSYMSTYANVSGSYNSNVCSKYTLDPWKSQNDIDFYMYGNTYTGMNAYKRTGENFNARPLSLRGPLVVTGFGYGFNGEPVPNTSGTWTPNYLNRSDLWKTGPVDLLWDEKRGVWTSHGVLKGITEASLGAGGSGTVNISSDYGENWKLYMYNYFSTAVSSGVKVIGNYIPNDNKWYVIAADC